MIINGQIGRQRVRIIMTECLKRSSCPQMFSIHSCLQLIDIPLNTSTRTFKYIIIHQTFSYHQIYISSIQYTIRYTSPVSSIPLDIHLQYSVYQQIYISSIHIPSDIHLLYPVYHQIYISSIQYTFTYTSPLFSIPLDMHLQYSVYHQIYISSIQYPIRYISPVSNFTIRYTSPVSSIPLDIHLQYPILPLDIHLQYPIYHYIYISSIQYTIKYTSLLSSIPLYIHLQYPVNHQIQISSIQYTIRYTSPVSSIPLDIHLQYSVYH